MESVSCLPLLIVFILSIVVGHASVISYNQPKFCANASWNPNASTFADSSIVGTQPCALFINTNNTIFMARQFSGEILIWRNATLNATTTILANLSYPWSMFVTSDGQIFVDNGYINHQVDRWTSSGTRLTSPISIVTQCSGVFVDVISNLYCSQWYYHQVLRGSLYNVSNASTIVAGTTYAGSAANMLSNPWGIFVTINLDLYVADSGNNRVQLFRSGEKNATTVVGNGSSGTILIDCPSGIVLDADGYLFIVDKNNQRILGSGPGGFRCVAGCSGSGGSASNKLLLPETMSFDRDGNIFVTDRSNNRLQKFFLSNNSCGQQQSGASTPSSLSSFSDSTRIPSILSTQGRTDRPTSSTLISTSPASMFNQSCFPPLVTVIPSGSNLSSPIQFRRSQDFYLTSSIEVNCNASLATQYQWLINNCSLSTCVNALPIDPTLIITTTSELYIPARTLPFGVFELKLLVTANASFSSRTSQSAFVRITASGITANLVPLGTSMITRGSEQDLQLNPGLYSLDPDENQFNASDWTYQYFCRIYDQSNFPNSQGSLISLDDSRVDPQNPSCLNNLSANGSSSWRYEGVQPSLKSSLVIVAGSLRANRTYQLMLFIENKRNNSLQGTGYLLLRVEDTFPQLIAIGCVISTLCVPNLEFQWINPTSQVALFALCLGNCSNRVKNITWNIYQGSFNVTQNITRWTSLNQSNLSVFGATTENFTATNDLFLSNPSILLWRFEVVYSFSTEVSSSSLNFVINQPPRNGSCSISPENGTALTLFTVWCPNWFDEDGIKDYSLFLWSSDPSSRSLIAFSPVSIFDVQLPAGVDPLRLMVVIRDQRDCLTEWTNLSSISVQMDSTIFNDLFTNVLSAGGSTTINPFVRLLTTGNQNQVGQVISSLSQQINQMNDDNLLTATSNGVPASSISISSLDSSPPSSSSPPLNLSALSAFEKQWNDQSTLREYLSGFLVNLPINTLRTIQIQSNSLLQLTQSTNQLTRTVLTIASDRCFRLASALNSLARRIFREEVQMSVSQLLQCTTNILTAVNGPLQERMKVLDADLADARRFPEDYQTDLEWEWDQLNLLADGEDLDRVRNIFDQKRFSSQVLKQMEKVSFLLTTALNIHLNVEQQFSMNTSNVFMSLETLNISSLLGKEIPSVGNARLRLPLVWNLSLDEPQTGSLRSTLEPLPSFESSSNTNLSRSISLTWMDQGGNESSLRTDLDHPIEIVIPHDPSLIIPPMSLQNVTGHQGFNFHSVDLSPMSSIHLEMRPVNINLSYAFIYRFDRAPLLNTSQPQIDGWTIFSPSNLANDSIHTFFLDNEQTSNHRSLIFALRQLNDSSLGSSWVNERVAFTSNYELRLYTSSCLYF